MRTFLANLFVASLVVCAVICGATSQARADGQISIRNFLEFGQRRLEKESEFIVSLGGRADLMMGAPKPRSFRIGPTFELRTVDFWSIEIGAGAGILIPTPWDLPIGLSGLIGYAGRRDAPDGLNGIGNVTWGFRGYNYHGFYGYALNLVGSARKSLTGDEVIEFTGGVEVDILFTTIIPMMGLRNLITGKDPHED